MVKTRLYLWLIMLLGGLSSAWNPAATTWEWDFGDGSPTSYEQNPVHVYTTPGTYTWTMTVNKDGQICQRTGTITVQAPQIVSTGNYHLACVSEVANEFSLWLDIEANAEALSADLFSARIVAAADPDTEYANMLSIEDVSDTKASL